MNRAPARGACVSLFVLLVFLNAGDALAQSRASYFDAVDTDRDGRISLPEYLERMTWAFQQMDRNGDKVLAPNEQLVPGAKTLLLVDLQRRLTRQFHRQDKSQDGSLSPAEYLAPPA